MEIKEAENDGVIIVAPNGPIDTVGSKPFGARLTALISGGALRLVIDLANVRYISSAGFRALLIAAKSIDGVQGRIVLCGLSAEIRRLFEIGGFVELFAICGTRDEACAKAK